MDAVIFDFDGVLVDSEPLHWAGFAEVLRGVGVELGWDDYCGRYLGFDDHDCFQTVLGDRGVPVHEEQLAAMIAAKTGIVRESLATAVEALPGARELVEELAAMGVPLAVCSGALAREIEIAARRVGVWPYLRAIVAAEDVRRGKPDPEGYLLALDRLGRLTGAPLAPARCVAIEDSPAGITAARAAGLKVIAVSTSFAAGHLGEADAIVTSLRELSLPTLRAEVG